MAAAGVPADPSRVSSDFVAAGAWNGVCMKGSTFPRQRLNQAVAMAWRAFERVGRQHWRVTPAVPILFFGDLDRYWTSPLRIVTVGLNPSLQEFPPGSPYRRFPLARDGTVRDTGRYLDALSAYFHTEPYRSWFESFEPLLDGAGSSYYGKQPSGALHTDICSPVATNPTWGRLADAARTTLEADGGPLWHELVIALKPHVVVLSVAKKHLARVEFKTRTELGPIRRFDRKKDGSPRAKPYVVYAWWCDVGVEPALFVFAPAAQQPLGLLATPQRRAAGAIVAEAWRRGCATSGTEPTGTHAAMADLGESFPPHDAGKWPVQMSLRHGDFYDDRGG